MAGKGRDRRQITWLRGAAAILPVLLLVACGERVQVRGNIPDAEELAQIAPGRHNRDDVARLLGSPSTVSTFRSNVWYYIGQRVESFAFFRPDVLERQVVEVDFDDRGLVRETRHFDLADGREIDPVDRVTPTAGREITVLQQLFGNIGRFSGEPSN